jgi:predicted ATPase
VVWSIEAADDVVTNRDTFIGRKRELAALAGLVARRRLVTLVGPAGSGKTRLALEVTRRAQRAHRDGARSVDLSTITDPELVVQAVARALRVRLRPGRAAPEMLAEALAEHELLLLLDNCEHVVDGCAATIAVLLRRCPALFVVATSREALRLRGEQTFPVTELPLPAVSHASTRTAVAGSDAVRLFMDRARAVDPVFRLTDDNAAAVAKLCHRLDGMPLAIELAARWVRMLGVDDILTRLSGRLDLLWVGDNTVSRRHRSLHAAIDWSYELLDPGARRAFRQLSLPAGPFTLTMAAAVCESPTDEVLRLLVELAAKSLLVVAGGPQAARFRLLEAIRVYGRDALTEAGELRAAQERLTRWLVGLVEPHLAAFTLPPDVVAQVDSQWPNLLAAIEWTAADANEQHATLVYALVVTWMHRNHQVAECRRLLIRALDGVRHRPEYASLLLAALASATSLRGDYEEALRCAKEAVEIERSLDRPARLAKALDKLGHTAWCLHDLDMSRACHLESLDILRSLDEPLALTISLNNFAWAASGWGEHDLAEKLVNEGQTIVRAHDWSGPFTALLHTAGLVALNMGDYDLAEAKFSESLGIEPPNPDNVPPAVEGLAIIAGNRGDFAWALRLAEHAAEVRRQAQVPGEPAWRERVEAVVAAARERLTPEQVAEAEAVGRRVSLEQAPVYARGHAPGPL